MTTQTMPATPAAPVAFATIGELRKDARVQAGQVLSRYAPGGLFPVDPIAVAYAMGIEVFTAQLGNDVYGMLIGSAGGPQMYLDVDQPDTKMRFTAAHEIGHYVDRQRGTLPPDAAYIDKRSEEGRGSSTEMYANEFAGSLLMPEKALKRYIDQQRDDYNLANVFGVSLGALRYRRQVLHL